MRRLTTLALILAVLAGCGWMGDGKKGKARGRRPFDQPGMPATPVVAAPGSPKKGAGPDAAPTRAQLPAGVPGLVVLIVLDTVRADHTSLCGYDRPTTPNLELLASRGAVSCDTYAPATWTLPSHASLFTGTDPEDHGMLGRGIALDDGAETLAEIYAERGYQTLFLSANPILKKPTGLLQGFHHSHVAPGIVSPLLAKGLAKMLRLRLLQLDRARPLFLVLNVYDAHDPYPEIPPGVDWVAPQPAQSFRTRTRDPDPTYTAFREGALPEPDAEAYLRALAAGYDYGIFVADQTVGRVVRMLERQGWSDHGVRLVVTSDHGENLGEHDRLRHDGPPFEGVSRVPLLFWETEAEAQPELTGPLSLTDAYFLVRDGAVPETRRPAQSGSIHYGPKADPWFEDALARWTTPTTKWFWRNDATRVVDLGDREGPEPEGEPAGPSVAEAFQPAIQRWRGAKQQARDAVVDDKVMRLLEQVGYVEEGEGGAGP